MASGEICRWGEGVDRQILGRPRRADRGRQAVYNAECRMWREYPSRTVDTDAAAEQLFDDLLNDGELQRKYPHIGQWHPQLVVDPRLKRAAGSFNPHTGVVKLRPDRATPFVLAHEYAHFVECTNPNSAWYSDGPHGAMFRHIHLDIVEVMYGPEVRQAMFDSYQSANLVLVPDPDEAFGANPPPLACAHGLWAPADAEQTTADADEALAEARHVAAKDQVAADRHELRAQRKAAAAAERRIQQQRSRPRCGALMPRAGVRCQRPAGHNGPCSRNP